MRFSAIAAMCAAPLALAGTLQADLFARGTVGSEVGLSVDTGISSGGNSKSSSDDNSKSSNNYNDGGNNIIIQESTTINEVIIIWVNNGGGQATTTVTSTTTVAGAASVVATHTVVVGGSAGLVYTPDTIEASIGDMVIFTFESQNHTATQSAFTTPCEKLEGGMDSGFMPNLNNSVVPPPQMAMQVTVATPIWFYCRQSGHCGKGMTFSINPTANKTQAQFQQMAIAQNGTGTTAVIAGGTASTTTLATTATTLAAAATSTSVNSGTMVSGSGTINTSGACECSCLCGVAAFPNAAVQGIGAFGGLSGAMPMSALES